MASPTSPTHGKLAALYRLRKNGFIGSGLNDMAWGGIASASKYYEVEIDAIGTPDTFQWRVNGGAWTTGVAITGASQAIDTLANVTFTATTGHTVGDAWVTGFLVSEPCTSSGATAQITATAKRMLNPNNPPVFTDSGGETVMSIDYVTGTAHFTGNVATVTATQNSAHSYIPTGVAESGLQQIGYLKGWDLSVNVDTADTSRCQQDWKEVIAGQAGWSGTANSYFIGNESFFAAVEDALDGSQPLFLVQFFSYDPDNDQTGDHFTGWALINGLSVSGGLGDSVPETVNLTGNGMLSFTENV